MELMSTILPEDTVSYLEYLIDDYFFLIAAALLVVELIRYGIKKQFTRNLLGDTITNFVTLSMFVSLSVLVATAYTGVFFYVYDNFRLTDFPITGWTLLGCLILADLAYYWEHRFLHSNGLAWGTHTVHHSSPHFNISVAYRFGPLDWLFPLFFHLPLVLLGFHPLVVFLCEVVVQVYQTLLHTEVVKKLPRPIEAVFNTPSHHRVHHGKNRQYLDTNYAGILIIWDRMFGTFAREEEKVRYGIFPAVNSFNPIKVFFSGYTKLAEQFWNAPSWSYRLQLLIRPPIWAWQQEQKRKREAQ
ncbi:hypothetical protein EOPP23_18245 [Endozoicomonas sp. OPT23]|uniref:sterol desaturase family protein n=1 Tax=Endozoicomonas sp. OPT23 TaxID=2072845 RepID=UPI00129AFFF2|nr:sterol desaturase family protein [Endozoicomonas sp. OPT23]MRI34919.1 hypothetical protein [Endozoicomonas sp. OPT23]